MSTAEKPTEVLITDEIDFVRASFDPEYARLFPLPDHTQLPDRDRKPVTNFQEHPQSILLTTSIEPVLERIHPDGHYAIGQDCGIYWKVVEPLVRGAICPDWFYIPNVPPTLNGIPRRSYVLWKEFIRPRIVLEFASRHGLEERDRTASTGKFWIYENIIKPAFYGIYEVKKGRIEMYHLEADRLVPYPPNGRGHFPINGLGVELGIWQGRFQNMTLPWMRWWDADGKILLTGFEMAKLQAGQTRQETERADREAEIARQQAERADREAEIARQQAECADREAEIGKQETERASRETERAERLTAQLRALGIEPEA